MKQQTMNDQSSNNWLGFSLLPQMKMELSGTSSDLHHHNPYRHQVGHSTTTSTTPSSSSAALPTSNFYLSPSHLANWVGVETAPAFHPPLSVMPLKSDGSLCIMEALSRSQPEGMVPSSSPKLEDFLGGASMGDHEYGSQEREAMALSLDSIYYNNNSDTGANNQNGAGDSSHHEANRENNPHPLDLLQHPFRPNHLHNQQQQHYYSGIPCHGMYQTQLGGEESSKDLHTIAECDPEISSNWMAAAAAAAAAVMSGSTTNVVEESGGGGVSGCVGGGISCGELQSLTLSMSSGSQSSCITAPRQISPTGTDQRMAMETKKRGPGKVGQKQTVHRKSIDTFGQRTSQFRGVTRHRWTGRYEAHLWDNSCKKEGQTRKGRQVYLGGYDMEEKAARAYDLAALKYWGPSTHINFPLENYQTELEEMKKMTRQEYVAHLRRKSSGFSRGASMYRGVTRHHQHGRWQARIGRVAGNKDLYLGTFCTQEEAAEAYDIAAIKFRGVNAVTNFDITRYDVEKIMASNTLLAGELARRNKETEPNTDHDHHHHHHHHNQAIDYNPSPQINGEINDNPESNTLGNGTGPDWKMALYQSQNPCVDSLDQKSISSGSYRNASFSMSLQDLVGIDNSVNSGAHQPLVEHQGSAKLGTTTATHFSNPSSLVTSLSSSREGSPDKTGPTNAMLFTRPPLASKFINPTSGVGSWFPSQLRPTAISMGHLPVFAAWNDT